MLEAIELSRLLELDLLLELNSELELLKTELESALEVSLPGAVEELLAWDEVRITVPDAAGVSWLPVSPPHALKRRLSPRVSRVSLSLWN